MVSPSLKLQDVSVSYSGKVAIENINIEVFPGEVFGLMGLNGAGKTTMIKAILGLRQQDVGDISILGHDKSSKESKAKLSYLPEKFEPPWFLTGMEFLKFSLRLYKASFNEDDIIHAAEGVALDVGALKMRVHTYSKGMRQKLGLIGTLLTGCSVFILDEPMSGLDPKARTLVKDMILRARGDERTIFLSSHILADMDEICDRVALLHDRTIRFVGTPDELKKKMGEDTLERAFLYCIEQSDFA